MLFNIFKWSIYLVLITSLAACATKPDPAPHKTEADIYLESIDLWANGQQINAESRLDENIKKYRNVQSLIFLRAAFYRSRLQFKKSSFLFNRVIELGTGSLEARCAAIVLNLDHNNNIEGNLGRLEALVEENPDNLLVRWLLAIECQSFNMTEKGVIHFQHILNNVAVGSSLVHQTYADLLEHIDRGQEALEHRRKALDLEPEAWAYHNLANAFSERGHYQEASDYYQKTIELEPSSSLSWQTYGSCLYNLGHFEDAIAKSEKAVWLDSTNSAAWHVWGLSLHALGRYDEANNKYLKAINNLPKEPFYHAARGANFIKLGEHRRAISDFDIALESLPDDLSLLLHKALALYNLEDYEAAILSYRYILTLDPAHVEAKLNLARTYIFLKQYEEALSTLEPLAQNETENVDVFANLGKSYFELGMLSLAIDKFRRAALIDPSHDYSIRHLALAYSELKNYQEAVNWFQNLKQLKPQDPDVYNDIGYTYFLWNKPTMAIESYQHALDLKADFGLCHYNKAMAHARKKEFKKAIASYDLAVSYGYLGTPKFRDTLAKHRK